MFNFRNIFYLLTSRTQKIAWWSPVFTTDFYIFSYNEQLREIYRNFIDMFLLYHTSLNSKVMHLFKVTRDFVIFVHSSDLCCGSHEQVSTKVLWYLCQHFFLIYSLVYIQIQIFFHFWTLVLRWNRRKQKFTNQNTELGTQCNGFAEL